MSLLGILVVLLIIGVVFWGATRLLSAFGVGDPLYTVIMVVLVILLLLWFLGQVGVGPSLSLR
jgi:hypothetical protein